MALPNYEKQINKSLITASISTDNTKIVVTTDYQITKINLDEVTYKNGSNLSISNGGIKIGKNITNVMISGSIVCNGDNETWGLVINKNGISIADAYVVPVSASYSYLSIPNFPINVQEGDSIYLYIYTTSKNATKNLKKYHGRSTCLTVQTI